MGRRQASGPVEWHLIPAVSSDPRSGFDEFYRLQYPRLVRVLFGVTGRWTVSEEICQESMMEAFRRWERVSALDRPDLWVRRVALHREISAHRRLIVEIVALTRVRVPAVSEMPGPADQQLWEQVQRLPRRQAVAIVLWAVEDRSHSEIAAALGCSEETARTHVRRARAALHRALGSEEVR